MNSTTMNSVALIGIDLSKPSFHLYGQNKHGKMMLREKVTRNEMFTLLNDFPPCKIAMESCTESQWIARRLFVMGHEVKLIEPPYVKSSNTNDFADAMALCEAARYPSKPQTV
ncbi:MAG: hypothetical protein FWH55_02705 [Oscillospiraceae bacterium]|nr:hypothetical protein [Oscillospiraceae bacterium]